MTRPDHPTVASVLEATAAVAASHAENDAAHRQAYDAAAPDETAPVDSGATESTALGY
jgi:hypothetical protein